MSMEEYRGKYAGDTVFIVGTGSSLNVLPVEKLARYHTMTVNYFIPHGVNRFSFTPDFWGSAYGGYYESHLNDIVSVSEKLDPSKIRLVLPEDYFSVIEEGWTPPISPVKPSSSDPVRAREVAEKFRSARLETIVVPISYLPPRFFGVGVITHLAIPFCCYLGFKRIVFVGMDLGGWNEFYAPRPSMKLRGKRLEEKRICWDGKSRPNYEAVKNLNWSIFSRQIPEYNKLIPEDVKFFHTTPIPKRMTLRDKFSFYIGLSKEAKTGFVDMTGEGFYIHKLEPLVPYVNFEDALRMGERSD
jgi:hypothetical protein